MHTKKRLRRSIALRSNRCTRRCLTAASERHGVTMLSNKWGGGRNRSALSANDGLTRPASECRAGRCGVAVCQCNAVHCVGINVIRLQSYGKSSAIQNKFIYFFAIKKNHCFLAWKQWSTLKNSTCVKVDDAKVRIISILCKDSNDFLSIIYVNVDVNHEFAIC